MNVPTIVATGHAYPSLRVDNAEYLRRCEYEVRYDPEAVARESGISARLWCAPGETTLTLARTAVKRALAKDPALAAEIGAVIVASGTTMPVLHPADPERPGVADLAPLLAGDLGDGERLAFDVKACYCTGFLRGLQLASALLGDGSDRRAALVVATEQGSRLATAASNRSSFCFLMSDAAGAAVVALRPPEARSGIVTQIGWSEGDKADWITVADDGRSMRVAGERAAKVTVERLVTVARRVLARARLGPGDVNWLLPVQTHGGVIAAIAGALEWPRERLLYSGGETGFSGSASIPACLSAEIERGRVRAGDLVLSIAVGAGLSVAGALFYVG